MNDKPEDFNIEDWLNGAKQPEKVVPIYQRPDLNARLTEIESQMKRLPAPSEEESMGGESRDLVKEYEAVAQQLIDSRIDFHLRALVADVVEEFDKKHPNMDGVERTAYLLAKAIVAPGEKWSAEQVKRLRRGIGEAQYLSLWVAYRSLMEEAPVPPAPFSRRR